MLRIHASYHKCLTMYFINVMTKVFNGRNVFSKNESYHHFESIEGVFYNRCHRYKVCSTNSFAIDANRLNHDYRITRFVRDPRDLIISGYFYHKRGAEPWFRMKNPTNKYWSPINGNVPQDLLAIPDISFAEYLTKLNLQEGLLAEMEFRKFHLESMRSWQEDDKIKLFKYKDIINNEEAVFGDIADHYNLPSAEKKKVLKYASKFSLKNQSGNKHIRNAKTSQWKEHFDDKVIQVFNEKYSDLLDLYGYE